jgi:hypothetical protein
MNETFLLAIVPATDKAEMNDVALKCFGDPNAFICTASPTGLAPATHWVVCGWWPTEFVNALSLGWWKQNGPDSNPKYAWMGSNSNNQAMRDMAAARGTPLGQTDAALNGLMARSKFTTNPRGAEETIHLSAPGAPQYCLQEFEGLQVIQGDA